MKRKLPLLLAVCLLSANVLAAQTRAADSLRSLLATSPRLDTLRVRRLQALAKELMMRDLQQATALLEQALNLSRRLADNRGEGAILIRLGTLYRLQTKYGQALRYTRQAQQLFRRYADHAGLSKTYLQLSLLYLEQENTMPALQAALLGLPHAEQAGDRVTQTRLQFALGGIYFKLGNYVEAIPVLQATLKNGQQLHEDYVVAATLELLGNTYQMLKEWAKAQGYFQRSLKLNRKLGDIRSATGNEIRVADLLEQQGNHVQALQYVTQARTVARTNQDIYNLIAAELILARIDLSLQQLDSAALLAQRNFSLSKGNNENLRNASDILAQAYAKRGDFAQAYHYQTLWVAYQDSLAGEETQRKTGALLYRYELDKKQSRIAVLDKEKQLQHQQLLGLLVGLGSTVLVLGLLWRNVYLKQRTNHALNLKNDQIAAQRDDLNRTLLALKATQSQLVQSEKMVALAALTAGVAHEIQNPLNFVNNFAEVSVELVAELEEEEQRPVRDPALEASLLVDLKQNLRKIHQHGARAGDIVKGMLEHARADAGQRQPVDLNAVAQDYLRLAYHDLQTKHRALAVARTFDLDPAVGLLALVPQEIGRVLLNLFTNALYAVHQKATQLGPTYAPEVRVRTRRRGAQVELCIRDNGTGIPPAVVEKIYDPFFTTKPAGEGTGLGLWFSYDIITKGYGGTLTVASQQGEYTEFVITLPLAARSA